MPKLRYTKEITEICNICGHKGKTEIHHIISQAKIERIKSHEHGADLDLTNNHGNLIELCVPCHDLTSHSWYRSKMIAEGKTKTVRKKGNRRRHYTKAENNGKPCLGTSKGGRPCGNKGLKTNGYCKTHQDQFEENKDTQIPVGLHDEGYMEEFEVDEIMLWRELGIEPDVEMFKDKSDAWKKRWLT